VRPGRAVSSVMRAPVDTREGAEHEHPLLGMPRRDTAVTIALAVSTAAVFGLMATQGGRDLVQPLDDAFLRLMVSIRTPPLTWVAMALNLVGLTFVMTPIRIGITAWLAIRRRWWHVTAFVSAIVVSEIAIGTLKALYDRPRALGSLVETSSASFPSGHAVAASVTAVAAVIALLPEGPRRYRWGAGAVAFSFLMAVSRTYLGAHWLSDAVAGVLLGTTIALGTALITHRVRERRERRPVDLA
jgi:membrane-associated phospholipid phosphatase